MKIKELKFFNYSIPFTKSFLNSKTSYHDQKGIIVELIDENNNSGYGEFSLFEGRNETIENVIKLFSSLNNRLIFKNLDLLLLENIKQYLEDYPQLSFAFQQAFYQLRIKNGFDDLSELFIKKDYIIKLNAVIGSRENEYIIKSIDDHFQKGYDVIKIKIGINDFEDDIRLLHLVGEKYKDKLKIRLDANSCWNLESAKICLRELIKLNMIEYIEQPVSDIDELEFLSELYNYKIAIDESMKDLNDLQKVLSNDKIKNIIIKPQLFGDILKLSSLIKNNTSSKIVISSIFETSLGKLVLYKIAAIVNGKHAHGLDTNYYLMDDIANSPFTKVKDEIISNYNTMVDFEKKLRIDESKYFKSV